MLHNQKITLTSKILDRIERNWGSWCSFIHAEVLDEFVN